MYLYKTDKFKCECERGQENQTLGYLNGVYLRVQMFCPSKRSNIKQVYFPDAEVSIG